MPVVAALALTLLVFSAACWLPPAPATPLLPADERTHTPELREACAVTATKCFRCHSLDRVLIAGAAGPRDWAVDVARMRRMAGSGITEADGAVIVRCLAARAAPPPAPPLAPPAAPPPMPAPTPAPERATAQTEGGPP
jgi:hypothetical protein